MKGRFVAVKALVSRISALGSCPSGDMTLANAFPRLPPPPPPPPPPLHPSLGANSGQTCVTFSGAVSAADTQPSGLIAVNGLWLDHVSQSQQRRRRGRAGGGALPQMKGFLL